MKEKLYTIEIMDAVKSGDECPFCVLERKLEQNAIAFVLGSSYMESDTRDKTDKAGFCRTHFKMMFQYGNQLGNAWILKSRFHHMNQEMKKQMETYKAPKGSFFRKLKKQGDAGSGPALTGWMRGEDRSCYICSRIEETYVRMMNNFVYLLSEEPELLELMKKSKGFCFHHFADIVEYCEAGLNEKEKAAVIPVLFEVMKENTDRIQADIDWFIEKQDYLNAEASWKDSKDAVQRTMQKLSGGYPADAPFKKQ